MLRIACAAEGALSCCYPSNGRLVSWQPALVPNHDCTVTQCALLQRINPVSTLGSASPSSTATITLNGFVELGLILNLQKRDCLSV
jgi:hypothetical protein